VWYKYNGGVGVYVIVNGYVAANAYKIEEIDLFDPQRMSLITKKKSL